MPTYNEAATIEQLAALPEPLRLVFALLCATRISPQHALLDRLWREFGGPILSDAELAAAVEETGVSDADDHRAITLAAAVRTRVTGAPEAAELAAQHAFLTALSIDELVGQRELARQARDLAELSALVGTDPGLYLALMRIRSEEDSASPLRAPAIMSALASVQRDPKRFFSGQAPSAAGLVTWLTRDLLQLGRGSCTLRNVGAWWIVGSDTDWLWHERFSPVELFARAVSDPTRGDDDLRAEILVAAFARSVWITLDDVPTRILGDDPPPAVFVEAAGLRRAVIFAM
jgi:hypothetical protein